MTFSIVLDTSTFFVSYFSFLMYPIDFCVDQLCRDTHKASFYGIRLDVGSSLGGSAFWGPQGVKRNNWGVR